MGLQLKSSKSLRTVFGAGADGGLCAQSASSSERLAILELNMEAMEQLSREGGDGRGLRDTKLSSLGKDSYSTCVYVNLSSF